MLARGIAPGNSRRRGVGTLEISLLGHFEVALDGERLNIPSRNAQSLFAFLLLNAGQAHRRERLAGLLWPDSSEDTARSNLRHELWRLRKALGPVADPFLLIDNLTITINPTGLYWLDVTALERSALEGNSSDELMEALSVYHGELLPGFYDEWVVPERERVRAIFEAGMARLLDQLQSEGRWTELQDWASRWIALGGWPEAAYRALMLAYARAGDLGKVVGTYERFERGFREELGLSPSVQTQALLERLRGGWKPGQEAGAAKASPVEPVEGPQSHAVRAAGLHQPPSNMPLPLTSFIGRERELSRIRRLLSESRLVTITGAGGVGKTRLAIQIAAELTSDYEDGVLWVELAGLAPGTVPATSMPVAHTRQGSNALGALPQSEDADQAGESLITRALANALRVEESRLTSMLEEVIGRLHDKKLLILLDNCEHMVAACAAVVERLLTQCPRLTVMATTREALDMPGERVWILDTLSLPPRTSSEEFTDIAASEAVRLFVDRATHIVPEFIPTAQDEQAIAHICVQLEGIPLAIELAAARMNLLSAGEIASRLDDRFALLTSGWRTVLPRHQTLRAAIEWSYDLLNDAEQRLFRRLSVFVGGFTLEAAEAICREREPSQEDTLYLLGRLVEKSLLQVDPSPQDVHRATRYRFLATTHTYARLKLDESGESEWMRERHAAYYVQLVESVEPNLSMKDQAHWYSLLQQEKLNISAVSEWSLETDRADSGLRIAGALMWFWWSQGSVRRGLDLVLRVLSLPSSRDFDWARGRALNTAGYLQWVLGDVSGARQSLEEAQSIFKRLEDGSNLAWSLQLLGLVLTSEYQYERADRTMRDGMQLAWGVGDGSESTISQVFLGDIAMYEGDHLKARQVYRECAGALHESGNKIFEAYPVRRLGYLELEHGDVAEACRYFRQSMRLNHEVADRRGIIACLVSAAALAQRLGDSETAACLLGVVDVRLESFEIHLFHIDHIEFERVRRELLERLDERSYGKGYNRGRALEDDQVQELVQEVLGNKDV